MQAQQRKLVFLVGIFTFLFHTTAFSQERDPVIFVHGLIVTAQIYEDVVPLKARFEENGYTVHIADRPGGIAMDERVDYLYEEIKRLVPTGKFHLVGHSAGGLDSRKLLHKYKDVGERCLSLTTMASPHHGSPIADKIIDDVDNNRPTFDNFFYSYMFSQYENGRELTYEVTTEAMEKFNAEVKDDSRVRYFSMGWYIQQPFFLYTRPYIWKNHITLRKMGIEENDGTVPVYSAKYGEYLGTFPGDHLSETTQIPYDGREIYKENFKILLQNLDNNFYQ